jgi:hypothetical protein
MSHLTNGLRAATAAALMGSFALAASGTATADPNAGSSSDINTLAGSLAKGYSLSNCQPAAADKLTFLSLAEIDCGKNADPSGPASAVYRLLGHGEALAAEFKALIKDVSQTPCVDGGQTPMTWQQGQATGQEACGTQNDVATIAWTTEGKNVLASIRSSNTDVNALRQWWRPTPNRHSASQDQTAPRGRLARTTGQAHHYAALLRVLNAGNPSGAHRSTGLG